LVREKFGIFKYLVSDSKRSTEFLAFSKILFNIRSQLPGVSKEVKHYFDRKENVKTEKTKL